jgi:sortase B
MRCKRNNSNRVASALTIIAILLILVAMSLLGLRLWQLYEQKSAEKGIRSLYMFNATATPEPEITPTPYRRPGDPTPAPTYTPEPYILPKFQKLVENNIDTVGWIHIPDTNIDHVVMQGDDNYYYLDHTFFEEESTAGCITLDFRVNVANLYGNILLYGHHMRVGSMLNDITKYKSKTFFKKQPIIYFDTIYEEAQWEVFSAYVESNRFNFFQMKFDSRNDYFKYIKALKKQSIYDTGVELTPDDVILTLSTCVYDFKDARMIVHARRKELVPDKKYD